MERVKWPQHLNLEAGLLFSLSIYRIHGRLALSHAPAADFPFTGSVILVAASLQEKHLAVALDEKGHDDQESSALLDPEVPQRTVTHRHACCPAE